MVNQKMGLEESIDRQEIQQIDSKNKLVTYLQVHIWWRYSQDNQGVIASLPWSRC